MRLLLLIIVAAIGWGMWSGVLPIPFLNLVALSSSQMKAIVLIKGDVGQGTGFLTHTADGPVVITNLHVVAGNPNLRITTLSGTEIRRISMKGASDRDLAMFTIEDAGYSYLDLAANVDSSASVGDSAIIPGNSEGGGTVLATKGKIVGIGPQKIEFSNPIYHGNSGSPVILLGGVVAVATEATTVNPTDAIDSASLANPDSAIQGSVRYFGVRIDNVPVWQNYNEAQYLNESTFLNNFHATSLALYALLTRQSPNLYLSNEKIRTIIETFKNSVQTNDGGSRAWAVQQAVWQLGNVADDGVDALQNPGSFYGFDQVRAREELALREQLRSAIQRNSNRLSEVLGVHGQ
jgi:hypothetical protein